MRPARIPPVPLEGGSVRLLALEVTTRCNLACVMCPHGVGAVASPADARAELVEALWPAMETAETVHLNGVGEPLLAGPFWQIVDRLSGRERPRIDFNTNGLFLGERNVERLAAAPLGTIGISFDAATASTYLRIRGGSFDRAKEGTRRLARRLGPEGELIMTFVVMRENLGEMEAFVDLAKELEIRIVWFAPLTDPPLSAAQWTVSRPDGWTFQYDRQRLRPSDPALLSGLQRSVERGRRVGVRVEGIDILALP